MSSVKDDCHIVPRHMNGRVGSDHSHMVLCELGLDLWRSRSHVGKPISRV